MGVVSDGLIVASVLTLAYSLTSRDRTVTALAVFIFLELVASLLIHWTIKGVGRSTPLMLLDCAGLYVMGLVAVCRLDRPLWLYGLCAATALECGSHLAYVGGWIGGYGHILSLNLLFIGQLGCLIAGRWGAPELESRRPARSCVIDAAEVTDLRPSVSSG